MLSTLRHIGAATMLVVAGGHAFAQPVRRLTAVRDLRIGAQALGSQRDVLVGVGPDGRVVVAPRFGGMPVIAFDSLGNKLPWKISVGRGDDSDLLAPSRLGWIAGTQMMWIADQGYRQVALVDAGGKVIKSVENPSWIHPSWAERRKYPVFATMQAFAMYKDETMLLLPGRERALLDTPGYDRSGQHLLRATWSGSIQRTVAMMPDDQGLLVLRGRGCQRTVGFQFAARPMWAVTPDGSRIVVARPGAAPADSGTIRITAMDERGDTVFSRVIAQPAVRVAQATIDNLLTNQSACGSFTADAIRDSLSRRITPFRSFLIAVVPGNDRSTWLTLRAESDTSSERTAIGLDERGEIIGAVTMPLNESLVAADRGHLWTLESGRMRAPVAVVRYRLEATPAPPPRSAGVVAAPRTSRPPG